MNESVCIQRFHINNNYFFKGIKIVSYHITYPQFIGNHFVLDSFNKKYYQNAINKSQYCRNVLYPQAVQSFLEGSKAFPYEMIIALTTTLQTNDIVSFYQTEYLYTGGANGQTIRRSQTINTFNGQVMQLCDFLQNKNNCEACIKKTIIQQIKTSEDPHLYFDNYPSLVERTFHSKNYYLTSEGLVVFFPLYEIAPHSTGIPTFLISYSQC